jgi:hypothetical protein
MCTLLRFPIEQCRPVSVLEGKRPGEIVIFPGVRIERDVVPATKRTSADSKAERREG